jgi:pseudaminic acid cytidylyltransferase
VTNIAIVPARAGSKRIPNKNVRDFCGQPMVAWTIRTLIETGLFSRIVVSTDSAEIATLCRSLGAEIPFLRPQVLADDHTPTLPVVAHALHELGITENSFGTFVCCAYATAPFITAKDIQDGFDQLNSPAVDYVFSATTFDFPVFRALRKIGETGVEPVFPSQIAFRSQDLPECIHDAGQYYWGTASAFLSQKPIFGDRSIAQMIPRYRVQDIDTEEDWRRAENIFQRN